MSFLCFFHVFETVGQGDFTFCSFGKSRYTPNKRHLNLTYSSKICVLSALARCVFTNVQKQFFLKLHEAVAEMKQKHEKTMFMFLNL